MGSLADFFVVFVGDLGMKKGAVKKSATKPVDSLDMEAHGL